MKISGILLAILGVFALIVGWQIEIVYAMFGYGLDRLDQGGPYAYLAAVERDRAMAMVSGLGAVIVGTMLFIAGARKPQ